MFSYLQFYSKKTENASPKKGQQVSCPIGCISMLFDNGMNPDEIRRLVGHENIEMTMQYCRGRHSQEELAQILEDIETTRGVTKCNTKNVTLSREKQKGNGGNAHFSRLPATHKHNMHKRTRHVRKRTKQRALEDSNPRPFGP